MNNCTHVITVSFLRFFEASTDKDALLVVGGYTLGTEGEGGNVSVIYRVYGGWAEAGNSFLKKGSVVSLKGFYCVDRRDQEQIRPYFKASAMIGFIKNLKDPVERLDLPNKNEFESDSHMKQYIHNIVEKYGFQLPPTVPLSFLIQRIELSDRAELLERVVVWLKTLE